MANQYHSKKAGDSRKDLETARQARRTYKRGLDFLINPDGTITRINNNQIEQGDYQYRVREFQDLIHHDGSVSVTRIYEE